MISLVKRSWYRSPPPLQPLEDAAESVLNFFHDNVGLSWGTAIIALTVCVRAVLIPLTYKQIKGHAGAAGAAAADQSDPGEI